jgi:hypothetical protein
MRLWNALQQNKLTEGDMNNYKTVSFCLCLMLLFSACTTVHFDKPIGAFQKSVDESIGVIGKYYQDLNSYERRLYLEGAFLDPTQEILFIDAQGKPTPLSGRIFSAKSIKARMDSLSLVSMYAKRLADLAGSTTPAKFSENTKVLGDNLTKLSDTFESLTGSDSTASAYIGPVSSLVGLVGQIYLEQRRDAALTKAITEGDPVVSKILDLLESDLVNVIDPLIKTGEKEHLAELVTYYNDNRKKMSQSERRQIIDNINAAAEQYSTALIFNPSSLVSGMIQAHQALIKYAKSSKKPNDFAELVSVLEVFTAHVDTVAGAIQEFQNK